MRRPRFGAWSATLEADAEAIAAAASDARAFKGPWKVPGGACAGWGLEGEEGNEMD